jgi:hypothetical protein
MKHISSFQQFNESESSHDYENFLNEFAEEFDMDILSMKSRSDSPTLHLETLRKIEWSWTRNRELDGDEAVKWIQENVDPEFSWSSDETKFYEVVNKSQYEEMANDEGLRIERMIGYVGTVQAPPVQWSGIVVKFTRDEEMSHQRRGYIAGKGKYGI